MLRELESELTDVERQHYRRAFQQAGRFIDAAEAVGGASAPASKSYPQPAREDSRHVDIEIITGTAFVPRQRMRAKR